MSRPRDRRSAHGLLPRMEAYPWKDGKTVSYRYHPLGGKPIPLGTDREAALRRVLDLTGRAQHHGTLRWVWEHFTNPDAPACRRLRLQRRVRQRPIGAQTRNQDDYH